MIHARSDYDGIQDATGHIPEDEPVFLLRSRDALAPQVVMFWAAIAKANGVAPEMVRTAENWALRMAEYNRGRTHLPDADKDVLR